MNGLRQVFYGLQVGMQMLVKDKLNDPKMILYFIRLQRSVENTMKQLYRSKYGSPCDNPFQATKFKDQIGKKRARDHDFEKFLKKARF